MNRILCSTGAVIGRPNGRDFTLLQQCVDSLRCDGFEFMMYDSWYEKTDALRSFLSGLSASFPVFHIEKNVGNLLSRDWDGDTEKALSLFESNCALAGEIGAEKLVLHLWGGLDSDKNIAHNIECCKALQEISDSYGLVLTVENVVCNRADPMSHLLALARTYPDIRFTFDTKMAAFHGQLDLLYAEENRWLFPRIRHMHINDYAGGYMDWGNLRTLHPGEGHVELDKLFAFLKQMNYQGDFTIEATSFDQNGVIDFDALNRTFDKLRKWLA